MKLLRWAVAGASAYAVYKYSIGKQAKGEDVLVSKEDAIADLTGDKAQSTKKTVKKPARKPAKKPAASTKAD